MTAYLDNPIYHSLLTEDASMNRGDELVCYHDEAVAPFIGMSGWSVADQERLLRQAPAGRTWFVIHRKPIELLPAFQLVFTTPLVQYEWQGSPAAPQKDPLLQPLGPEQVEEMLALTALTRPGPFMKQTLSFGNYYGIIEDGRLAAMGGERMHLPGLTEISAICTHPDYLGRGYGARIVQHLSALVLERGQKPFLHSRKDNERALALYRRMGFAQRADMYFAIFRRAEDVA